MKPPGRRLSAFWHRNLLGLLLFFPLKKAPALEFFAAAGYTPIHGENHLPITSEQRHAFYTSWGWEQKFTRHRNLALSLGLVREAVNNGHTLRYRDANQWHHAVPVHLLRLSFPLELTFLRNGGESRAWGFGPGLVYSHLSTHLRLADGTHFRDAFGMLGAGIHLHWFWKHRSLLLPWLTLSPALSTRWVHPVCFLQKGRDLSRYRPYYLEIQLELRLAYFRPEAAP